MHEPEQLRQRRSSGLYSYPHDSPPRNLRTHRHAGGESSALDDWSRRRALQLKDSPPPRSHKSITNSHTNTRTSSSIHDSTGHEYQTPSNISSSDSEDGDKNHETKIVNRMMNARSRGIYWVIFVSCCVIVTLVKYWPSFSTVASNENSRIQQKPARLRIFPRVVTLSEMSSVSVRNTRFDDAFLGGADNLPIDDEMLESHKHKEPYDIPEIIYSETGCSWYEWQVAYHPNCNDAHVISLDRLLAAAGSNDMREGPRFTDAILGGMRMGGVLAVDDNLSVLYKTLKYWDFDQFLPIFLSRAQREAIIADIYNRATPKIFGHCGLYSLGEVGKGLENSLRSKMKRPNPTQKLSYAMQLAESVTLLHNLYPSSPTIYRDFDQSNVMIVGDRALLIDFDQAEFSQKKHGKTCYPSDNLRGPYYDVLPLEVVQSSINASVTAFLTEKTDVYGLGSLFFSILTDGARMYHCEKPMGVCNYYFKKNNTISENEIITLKQNGQQPSLPRAVEEDDNPALSAIRDSMKMALQKNPSERPAAQEILEKLKACLYTGKCQSNNSSEKLNPYNNFDLAAPSTISKYTFEMAAQAVEPTTLICGEMDRHKTLDPITNQRPFFAFVHVHKASGSTVREFFREYAELCKKSVAIVISCHGLAVDDCKVKTIVNARETKSVNSAVLREQFDILGGHFSFGMADDVFTNTTSSNNGVRHIVFLRQPMARYVSQILYKNNHQKHTAQGVAEYIKNEIRSFRKKGDYESSIYKYLLTPSQREMKYEQKTSQEEIIAHKGRLSIDNLVRYNAIVGMTESFPQSMQLLEHAMGQSASNAVKKDEVHDLYSRYYSGKDTARNVSKRITTTSVMNELMKDDGFMKIFREFVKYEQLIVDFAMEMHLKQLEAVRRLSGIPSTSSTSTECKIRVAVRQRVTEPVYGEDLNICTSRLLLFIALLKHRLLSNSLLLY